MNRTNFSEKMLDFLNAKRSYDIIKTKTKIDTILTKINEISDYLNNEDNLDKYEKIILDDKTTFYKSTTYYNEDFDILGEYNEKIPNVGVFTKKGKDVFTKMTTMCVFNNNKSQSGVPFGDIIYRLKPQTPTVQTPTAQPSTEQPSTEQPPVGGKKSRRKKKKTNRRRISIKKK